MPRSQRRRDTSRRFGAGLFLDLHIVEARTTTKKRELFHVYLHNARHRKIHRNTTQPSKSHPHPIINISFRQPTPRARKQTPGASRGTFNFHFEHARDVLEAIVIICARSSRKTNVTILDKNNNNNNTSTNKQIHTRCAQSIIACYRSVC